MVYCFIWLSQQAEALQKAIAETEIVKYNSVKTMSETKAL